MKRAAFAMAALAFAGLAVTVQRPATGPLFPDR